MIKRQGEKKSLPLLALFHSPLSKHAPSVPTRLELKHKMDTRNTYTDSQQGSGLSSKLTKRMCLQMCPEAYIHMPRRTLEKNQSTRKLFVSRVLILNVDA